MTTDLADYEWLAGDEAGRVLADAAQDARPLHQRLAGLRTTVGAQRAGLVCELVEQRRRGREKFGPLADRLFGAKVQWEQATDGWIAAYKAARFAAAGADEIDDFCCGLGGDLLALSAVARATGYDKCAAAVTFARANLAAAGLADRGAVTLADVETIVPAGDAWHVDPDRRPAGRRTTTPELHAPSPATIDRWLAACGRGAIKLAPATRPFGGWAEIAEWEWLSRGRECRQLVAWFGLPAPLPAREGGLRRATRVSPVVAEDSTFRFDSATFAAFPEVAAQSLDAPQAFLIEPDPSLIAADLVGALANRFGLATLGAGSVYLAGEVPVGSPLVTNFAVTAELPLRSAAVAKHLASKRIGTVEIKVRGVSHSPEDFRRSLKLQGDNAAVVFLTRIGRRETTLIAERLG